MQVLMQKVVLPVAIISRIYTYTRKAENLTTELVIHILSDGGSYDTVIGKLIDRAMSAFSSHYQTECAYGLERFAFLHTGMGALTDVPQNAHLIYLRGTDEAAL